MMWSSCLLFLLECLLVDCFLWDSVNSNSIKLYVNPTGSDSNTGSDTAHPIKTIQHALFMTSQPAMLHKDITINLMHGYHDVTAGVSIGQTTNRHITIQAYRDQEVHVTGGRQIPVNTFDKVTDPIILSRLPQEARNKVMVARLSEAGIHDLGKMTSIGAYRHRIAPLEIFYNNEPMRLAQWPNEEFVNVLSVPAGRYGKVFTYAGDRPYRWSQENDMWAHGYWYWSWSDHSVKIQSINTKSREITLNTSPNYGLRVGHYNATDNTPFTYTRQGGYYKVINVLAELDQPGEYYVDRSSGMLYIWPPTSDGHMNHSDVIYGSMARTCINIENGASLVTLKGFTIEACRQYGVTLTSAQNITLLSMEIKNTGSYNFASHKSCNGCSITKSYFHDGDGGVSIGGGDRPTLAPSSIVVSDNRMWRYSRVAAVGYHAINVFGVGAHVHHNHVYIGQYTGIFWRGNDHIIEYNHVHHTCMNSSDCGGIHTGRDWTTRGNIIRMNYVHHTLRFYPGADVRGIMLDDQYSSVLIEHNVFFDNEVHVNIGGGRDNVIRNNVFYNATRSSMQVDDRGIQKTNDAELRSRLKSMPYKSSLWTSRYPKLAHMDLNSVQFPEGNQINDNVFYDTTALEINGLPKDKPDWFNVTHNARAFSGNDFYDPSNLDFRPRCHLSDVVRNIQFTSPIKITNVGPRYQIGPGYLHMHPIPYQTRASRTHACTTKAPKATPPRPPYLTDGSVSQWSKDTASASYNISKVGCWLKFDRCPNRVSLEHDGTVGSAFHRDVDGEKAYNTGHNETACLERVPHYIAVCGRNSSFTIVYGPTGNTGQIFRDVWAETHFNASTVESDCLNRVLPQFTYCHNDANHPVTSIFRPTGHSVTVGGGCWIKITQCPAHPRIIKFFYESVGATNFNTDLYDWSCFDRAAHYWHYCGNHAHYPVTAYFRPTGQHRTYP